MLYKYNTGQRVRLTSKLDPSLNGVYTILMRGVPEPGQLIDRTGERTDQPIYLLDGLTGWWAESALSEA